MKEDPAATSPICQCGSHCIMHPTDACITAPNSSFLFFSQCMIQEQKCWYCATSGVLPSHLQQTIPHHVGNLHHLTWVKMHYQAPIDALGETVFDCDLFNSTPSNNCGHSLLIMHTVLLYHAMLIFTWEPDRVHSIGHFKQTHTGSSLSHALVVCAQDRIMYLPLEQTEKNPKHQYV